MLKQFLNIFRSKKSNERMYPDWKLDDMIIMKGNEYDAMLKAANQEYGHLKGWSKDNIYLAFGSSVYQVEWKHFECNKSARWRKNYEECKLTMKKSPGFEPGIKDTGYKEDESVKEAPKQVNGKNIDELNETECQIYLKRAIEDEDFETAELIKKRLEKL